MPPRRQRHLALLPRPAWVAPRVAARAELTRDATCLHPRPKEERPERCDLLGERRADVVPEIGRRRNPVQDERLPIDMVTVPQQDYRSEFPIGSNGDRIEQLVR